MQSSNAAPKQERWTSEEVTRLLELRFREGPESRLFAGARCHRDKQRAWRSVSEKLRAELPLPSGDERSPAQCEQKLKNLRKEYVRLQGYQLRRHGNTKLPLYWELLKETVGKLVDNGAPSSPSSSTESKSHEVSPLKNDEEAKRPSGRAKQINKRQRDNSMLSPSDFSSGDLRVEHAAVGFGTSSDVTSTSAISAAVTAAPAAKRTRAPAPSAQILQSVDKLNKLVAEFVASDKEAAARSDMERRLEKVESDVALLRASVQGMSDKMECILTAISEWKVPDRSTDANETESDA